MYLIEALSSLNGQIPQCLREQFESLPQQVLEETVVTHIGECGSGVGYVARVVTGPMVPYGKTDGVLICASEQICSQCGRCRQIPTSFIGVNIRVAGGNNGGSIAYPCYKLDYEEWIPELTK